MVQEEGVFVPEAAALQGEGAADSDSDSLGPLGEEPREEDPPDQPDDDLLAKYSYDFEYPGKNPLSETESSSSSSLKATSSPKERAGGPLSFGEDVPPSEQDREASPLKNKPENVGSTNGGPLEAGHGEETGPPFLEGSHSMPPPSNINSDLVSPAAAVVNTTSPSVPSKRLCSPTLDALFTLLHHDLSRFMNWRQVPGANGSSEKRYSREAWLQRGLLAHRLQQPAEMEYCFKLLQMKGELCLDAAEL